MIKTLYKYKNIGTKLQQEDLILINTFKTIHYFFLFDGHGCKKNKDEIIIDLHKNLFKFINKFFIENNLELNEKVIVNLFKELANNYKNYNSGACFSAFIYKDNDANGYLCQLGDTRIQLYNNNKLTFQTPIHDLNNSKERSRIIKYKKEYNINKNRYRKLNMLRTLGDSDCKDLFNEPILSVPEIFKVNINKIKYMFFFSDGLIIDYDLQQVFNNLNNKESLSEYVNSIYEKSLKKYSYVDNISILILVNEMFKKNDKFNYGKFNYADNNSNYMTDLLLFSDNY